MKCKICSRESGYFSTATLINKYQADYFQCSHCGFIQTEAPYWLEDAYSDAIKASDLGLLGRNVTLSKLTKNLIHLFFNSEAKFLDYGGGYGVFVRLMRDFGFDFWWYDKFCQNLFAQGFEAEDQNQTYELATAFEVFEHLVAPLDEIENILQFSSNIFFTTNLIPQNRPNLNEWWYYGLDHGQHVSLYTYQSLSVIAANFSLNLYSNGHNLHLLTKKKIPPALYKLALRHKIVWLLNTIQKKKSLLAQDYFKLTGRDLY